MGVPESVILRQKLRESIRSEIAARTETHQSKVARFAAGQSALAAAGNPPSRAPLVLLAHGDSWFDYPLSGNDISLGNTDIVVQLQRMGAVNPAILNLSHHGDATSDELSLPKQERMIEALQDPNNWPKSGKPDAILFSGGGNDIAGNQFCIFLDLAGRGSSGLNEQRFTDAIGMVWASYLDLFAFRDKWAAEVPIFGHCYDFPIPNGAHPLCAGPWLKPSLDYCGWTNVEDGTAIVRDALIAFRRLLVDLAAVTNNRFILVDTQKTLAPENWANELHPYPDGFKMIANKFVEALRVKFPGRI